MHTFSERICRHDRKLSQYAGFSQINKSAGRGHFRNNDGDCPQRREDTPDVFGEEIAVRIRGIDTPELNDKREEIKAIAIKAKEELERLLTSGKKIVLYNLGRDKYFRLLASVATAGFSQSRRY